MKAQGYTDSIHVSAELGPGPGGRCPSSAQRSFQEFLALNLETGALISVALVLTHPEQYALTRACLQKLSAIEHINERLMEWSFGFNVVTVVVNRQSPFHRDRGSGGADWLENLMNIGGDDGTVLELPGIGVRFQYSSGTMALFSGHTHLHGVSEAACERVCFASYARPPVLRLFNLFTPDPPSLSRSLHHQVWKSYIGELVDWAKRTQKSA